MTTITKASHQWATRPNDQRFTSLTELNAHCQSLRDNSNGRVVSSRRLEAVPVSDDNKAILLQGPNGVPVDVTHWAFGQLAQRAGAPAGYLRDLPAPLAADCINYGLRFHRDVEDLGVLLTKGNNEAMFPRPQLRAVTGPNYGRVWNSTITHALQDRFGDGITGDFRIPGEFGKAIEVTKANTTLYASDRDMFVFLADEKNRINLPGRRDGHAGSLARGFFVWNSEVGDCSFGIGLFLFDYVCCNRIVWGAQDYKEIRIRHTASAPDRWIEEVVPAIEAYAASSTAGVEQVLLAAQKKKVGDIDDFLKRRFNNTQTSNIKAAFLADEQRPIETLWDVATGITAYARNVSFQNERVKLEREAGKVLDLAS
jgi:hypothetical protein